MAAPAAHTTCHDGGGNGSASAATASRARLVYICDWLPPDYGAVGQYSLLFARERAAEGADVVLGGLGSGGSDVSREAIGAGHLTVVRIHAAPYDKGNFAARMWWTCATNTRLIWKLWAHLRRADEILFTGSPPLFLHWISLSNLLLGQKLTYRITDFHPECLMAARETVPLWLKLVYRLTLFWRRRVWAFEVLGNDQLERLSAIGIPRERIALKRDPSPVAVTPETEPLARPISNQDSLILLYSGNWGTAHDYRTFVEAYRRHHREGSRRFVLWLNAVGAAVDEVEAALRVHGLPFISGKPVPLEKLASLLVTPDAHLITLSDDFVGFVLPSKVYGCIASRKAILFIGSARSDVHELCSGAGNADYERVEVGDVAGAAAALERIADAVARRRGQAI
jgi:hypothetical protein